MAAWELVADDENTPNTDAARSQFAARAAKKSLIISSLALVCLALALGLVLVPMVHAASGGSSKTAQSVMVQTNLSNSPFEIVGDTTYHWDP